MGHPALLTASRGHAVVRSLGALGALLGMTTMGRAGVSDSYAAESDFFFASSAGRRRFRSA
jgi:hypothetical protein